MAGYHPDCVTEDHLGRRFRRAAPRSNLADYQRLLCWRRPPPPPEPSVFGRASFTFSALPSRSRPLSSVIALSASALLLISTNPNPLAWPVSRSVIKLTRSTVPYASNIDRTALSVAPKLRLPTKTFFITTSFYFLLIVKLGQDRTRAVEPG